MALIRPVTLRPRLVAAALRAEADTYVNALTELLDEEGHRMVVRNGYAEPRTIMCAAGAIEVRAPRVNDKRVDEMTGERKRQGHYPLTEKIALRVTDGQQKQCPWHLVVAS
jgi:hypothetical protein